MHIYCVFCQTQRCGAIASWLSKTHMGQAVSPKVTMRERKEGVNRDVLRDLLPGYVFLFSEEGIRDFSPLHQVHGLIRILGSSENGMELRGTDAEFALRLLGRDGVVDGVKVFRTGDRVRLADPLFSACEGRIAKVDHRKRRAKIDYVFNGMSCSTWAAMDEIDAADSGTAAP